MDLIVERINKLEDVEMVEENSTGSAILIKQIDGEYFNILLNAQDYRKSFLEVFLNHKINVIFNK